MRGDPPLDSVFAPHPQTVTKGKNLARLCKGTTLLMSDEECNFCSTILASALNAGLFISPHSGGPADASQERLGGAP